MLERSTYVETGEERISGMRRDVNVLEGSKRRLIIRSILSSGRE
jgi:hypothetical protein